MMVTDCPVYGSDLTLGLLRERLRERDLDGTGRLVPVRGRDRIQAGPFTVEFLHVTHSVPGTFALAIGTPAGLLVVGADFKLDPTPVGGPPSDLERLSELGRAGVRVLLLDSTNARNEGSTPSERAVAGPFARLLESAPKRIFATTFSSHLHRVQLLAGLAAQAGRRVAVVGRRMNASVRIGRETGHLALPAGALVEADEAMGLPPERVLIIAGGSQGEPSSAMTRIARGEHPDIRVEPGDIVVHSARPIPGNELAISRMLDALARRGAAVLAGPGSGLHVSGHACADDLASSSICSRPRRSSRSTAAIFTSWRASGSDARAHARPARPWSRRTGISSAWIRRGVADRGTAGAGPPVRGPRAGSGRPERRCASAGRSRVTGSWFRWWSASGEPAGSFSGRGSSPGGLPFRPRRARSSRRPRGSWRRRRARRRGSGPERALEELVTDEVRRFVRRRTGKRPLVAPIVVEV